MVDKLIHPPELTDLTDPAQLEELKRWMDEVWKTMSDIIDEL